MSIGFKKHTTIENSSVTWNPWWGLTYAVLVFIVSQLVAGLLLTIYPSFKHWTPDVATKWLNDSVVAQFVFVILAETLTIWGVYLFLKRRKLTFSTIGLKKPRWIDPLYGLLAVPAYLILYLVGITAISHLFPSLNVNEKQQLGFSSVHGVSEMIMTFISLVILPPLAEEIIVRGFIYSSLRKAMKIIPAAIITSLIFASAHLSEGGAAGPLYIAAIDTFFLSLVLVYLREKTGSLWAGITLHALKNGIAFFALFVAHT